jgi:hypothetical protein
MFKNDLLQDESKISEMELNSHLEENSEKKSIADINLVEEASESNKRNKKSLNVF